MDVQLVLLMNCVALVYCQSTTSMRNDAEWQNEYFDDVKSELESIRQLLMTQQKSDVSNDRQAIQEMKAEIQEIRQNLSEYRQLMETIRDKLHEIGIPKKKCPQGFDYLPEAGSCYRVILERMNWDVATERCRQLLPGVHLAAITSKNENDAIVRYLQSQFSGGNNYRCTQLNWPEAGNMIWTSGQTRDPRLCNDPYVWKPLKGIEIPFNYTNWAPNYPDCYQESENCLQIATGLNYAWNDHNCNWTSCAICEL